MKASVIIAFTILCLNLNAQTTTRFATGPHGGALNVSQGYKIELVNRYNGIITYLFDKDLTPIPNKGIYGEILFVYNDNLSLSKKLIPFENEGFTVEIGSPYYVYSVITFNISGKMIVTKFQNQSGIAQSKKKKSEK